MSISSISSSYTSALYQWQNQQLTSSGSTSSQSSASSSLSSLLGSYSITSQVSSMVELTQYAMDAMGLSDDSRVTFNQILKYRDQLTSEFNASVQEGLADLGVSDPEGVTFTLAADGQSDRQQQQRRRPEKRPVLAYGQPRPGHKPACRPDCGWCGCRRRRKYDRGQQRRAHCRRLWATPRTPPAWPRRNLCCIQAHWGPPCTPA